MWRSLVWWDTTLLKKGWIHVRSRWALRRTSWMWKKEVVDHNETQNT
jgi:hypothetical protein